MTRCYQTSMSFSPVKRHKVEADISSGDITSNAGIPLLAQVDQQMSLTSPATLCRLDQRSDRKAAVAILLLLVKALRQRWPKVEITFRGDSGFCRWKILRWCERHQVRYIVSIAQNKRLKARSAPWIDLAVLQYALTDKKQRLPSPGSVSYCCLLTELLITPSAGKNA